MTLTLPDDPALTSIDDALLRLDLACGLLQAGRVSRGVAARVAGLEPPAFDEEISRREIHDPDAGDAAWGKHFDDQQKMTRFDQWAKDSMKARPPEPFDNSKL